MGRPGRQEDALDIPQHDQMDAFVDAWLAGGRVPGRQIFCRKGCAGCCNLAVHATWPEAVAAAAAFPEQHAARLSAYVERLMATLSQLADLKTYLKLHRQTIGPCPFLTDKATCALYDKRPISCRALLSTRPAAWCTVDFSTLSTWDKQAFVNGLDRDMVAWPSHYVAATQDFGQVLERTILDAMQRQRGWAMSGNFALMVWLELNHQLSTRDIIGLEELRQLPVARNIASDLLLNITGGCQEP